VYEGAFNFASPLAIVNSLSFAYYGVANIPEYLIPDLIYSHNKGAEEFYIPALAIAVASTFAVDWSYRTVSHTLHEGHGQYPSTATLREFRLGHHATGAIGLLGTAALALMLYCALKYDITSPHQILTDTAIDNILILSFRGMAATVAVAFTYRLSRTPNIRNAVLCLVMIGTLAPMVLMVASRLVLFSAILCIYLVFVLIRGSVKRRHVLLLSILLLTGWFVVRAVKDSRGLLRDTGAVSGEQLSSTIADRSSVDFGYRLAGLDFVAALWNEQVENQRPAMFGQEALDSLLEAVPSVLWPEKQILDPKEVIYEHYSLFEVEDQIMTPLPSALADAGALGAIVIMAMFGGVLCVLQHCILRARYGMLVYLCSLPYLFYFEDNGVDYLLLYGRFTLVVWIVLMAARDLHLLVAWPTTSHAR
jgi:hypothetical protein